MTAKIIKKSADDTTRDNIFKEDLSPYEKPKTMTVGNAGSGSGTRTPRQIEPSDGGTTNPPNPQPKKPKGADGGT